MASLRGFLPSDGSTVWRNDRRLTRTSSSGEGEYNMSRTRIKHIVIREVWKKTIPSPHAVYKIDVMTQSNHWFILRRYREFYSLHQNLVKHYGIPSDMLPSKKIPSNMSLSHLEKRRSSLEHYLQRLINSHCDIAHSKELFHFLNVETHDVLCVTRQLATVLENEGRNVLASGGQFTFTPTQMYCITRQLQLPHVAAEPSEGEEFTDLGYLYGFIQELKSLRVDGLASQSSPCRELVSNQAFDISLFKSLEKLQIDKCHVSVIDGLFKIQKQLTHVTLRNSLKTMKEFLVDCAMQRRVVNQANASVESWRNHSTTKLTDNRVVVRPWVFLSHVNMSHNKIAALDYSLKLLPALEQLDLSHNDFVHLDLKQLASSTLTFLNLSHNNIHYISATTKDLRNLKSLLLSHNKLQSLDGLGCLRGLVELDGRHNEIKRIEELAKLSPLLHMRILALAGNPCVATKSHRIHVFAQLKSRELILDGIKITENEKAKVHLQQERKSKGKGTQLSDLSDSTVQNLQLELSTNDLNKKVLVSDRDDDQDSGFGGNYGGSMEDGGLVFDWGCFGNNLRMADVFENSRTDLVPRPSTSWHDLESSVKPNKDAVLPDRSNCCVDQRSSVSTHTLQGGQADKGKSPLRAGRLEQTKKAVRKSPTSKRRQPEVVPNKVPELDQDFVGPVRREEFIINDLSSGRTLENDDEPVLDELGEMTKHKKNCGKENNMAFIDEFPVGGQLVTSENCTSVCRTLSRKDTSPGQSSLDLISDTVVKSSPVVDESLLHKVNNTRDSSCTVTGESLADILNGAPKSSSFTENDGPATVCAHETKSPSLVEEFPVSDSSTTGTKSCTIAGNSLPLDDLQPGSLVEKTLLTVCDNKMEYFSPTGECLPTTVPEVDAKSCTFAEESSGVVTNVDEIPPSFVFDETKSPSGESFVTGVCDDGTESSVLGECSVTTICDDRTNSARAKDSSTNTTCDNGQKAFPGGTSSSSEVC